MCTCYYNLCMEWICKTTDVDMEHHETESLLCTSILLSHTCLTDDHLYICIVYICLYVLHMYTYAFK